MINKKQIYNKKALFFSLQYDLPRVAIQKSLSTSRKAQRELLRKAIAQPF